MALQYVKTEPLWLKNDAAFNEAWLEELIAKDPSLLGLGDVVLKDRQRRQEKAGRLDLLLESVDEDRRYEVEIMLGATDESHIIRSIEYWDIERRRYPAYEHCAVLVAENVTSRFLNVLSLFAGSIPFIAIQLRALKVGEQIVLDFVKVLDSTDLRRDDDTDIEAETTDRSFWENKATPRTVQIADRLLEILNAKAEPKLALKYVKNYISLRNGSQSYKFAYFKPRKQYTLMLAEVTDATNWAARLNQAGLDAKVHGEKVQVILAPEDLSPNSSVLSDLLSQAYEDYSR